MAGQPENREKGTLGGSVVLDVKFFNFTGGNLVDDDGFVASGTLPVVEIYDPNGTLIVTSATSGELQPVRVSVGDYEYTRPIGLTDEVSDKWKITWKITIDGSALTFSELFIISEAGAAGFGDDEFRIGYAFNNPDLSSSHHAPDWGLLVSPDELRYLTLFGTKLTSPEANQTYDDNMLQWHIDQAIAMIEQDLNIDILPRIIRHEDPIINTGSTINVGGSLAGEGVPTVTEEARTSRKDIPDNEVNIREEGYPYRPQTARHFLFTKLKRRPLIDVLKTVLSDPIQNTVLDLYPWRRVFKGFASYLQFVANLKGGSNYPLVTGSFFRYPYNDFPTAIYIDYRTGHLKAADVPMEFREVVMWIAGIQLLSIFSDGKVPGIASASVNLNSISESFSTTQSATNSLYGARIAYYKNHVKDWFKKNRFKYQRTFIGVL